MALSASTCKQTNVNQKMDRTCRVEYSNPNHYSFQLCANANANERRNKFNRQKIDSFYDYQDASTSKSDFHCERCDRTMKNEAQYKQHIAEHVVCRLDGCQFTAHPKVVAKHVQMQHDTGLYKKLKDLQKPEDIYKWIAERKRRYPTRENIAKKAQVSEQKERRGERIKPDESRFNKRFHGKSQFRISGSERRHRRQERNKRQPRVQPLSVEAQEVQDEYVRWNGRIPRFPGTGSLHEIEQTTEEVKETINSFNITDDEEEPSPSLGAVSLKNAVNRSLGLLMASYGTDESDLEPETKPELQPPKKDDDDSNGPPEEVKTIKSTILTEPDVEESTKRPPDPSSNHRRNNKRFKSNEMRSASDFKPRRRKPTLLERLLSKEIRHERNVVLQCVRHVVNCNFFDPVKIKVESNEDDGATS